MERQDARQAFYQTPDQDGRIYAAQVSSGTTCYLDLDPGWYDCWAPAGAAGEHFRWCYLPAASPAPTIAPASFPAPTAATSAQTEATPTGALGSGMAPANASPIRIFVPSAVPTNPGAARVAILYSAAGPVTLYCSKVL